MQPDRNPFQPPTAVVDDISQNGGEFLPEGQSVPAGHGVDWLSQGWALFRKAPGVWIGLTLVYMVLFIILGMIPLVNFLLNVLIPVFTGGIMLGCKALEDGEELTVGHLFAGFSGYAGKLMLVGLIYLAGIFGVGLLMVLVGGGLGFASFATGAIAPSAIIVPVLLAALLIVPLAMALCYAPALVVFHDVAPFQAMQASFFVSLKNIMPFLIYGLVIIVLAVLASLPIFLGWLVLIPVIQASIYASYKDMFTRN